uniref:Nucleoporin NUP42 n=1 Tax=Anopheles coluzzii TaxID=1518534 RepID=A0A8W7P0L0_ANOCL
MVLCMYFLNNSCRFGSRCNNEHIDIGSIVKTEVDVSLKGNQWPLSCFGPFKERNCIPSFIEDLSFEEIRMMYLEAKMQNNIPAHQMQLAQMINDAKTKMQCLTTMNRDILNTLVEIYNQQKAAPNRPTLH